MSIDVRDKKRTVSESSSFDDGEGEDLDPRIKCELEHLNAATDGINHLETELNEAQVLFNEMMEDAATQLKALHQKLGKCVDKARPYYEALKNAKQARTQLHEASLSYELTQAKHFNAKKRVVDAERKANQAIDGKLDPDLQELLNQVTTEVMESAVAYEEAVGVHTTINDDFNQKHINLQEVYDKLKPLVAKSRPFFELKSDLNRNLEVQKQRVEKIQEGISLSKQAYSETLGKLQIISDDIHRTRTLKRQTNLSSVSENSSSDDTQNSQMTRNASVDDTSEIFTEDDSKSVDSVGSGDNSIWEPGSLEEDRRSTTSRNIEYNLLKSRASMDNTNGGMTPSYSKTSKTKEEVAKENKNNIPLHEKNNNKYPNEGSHGDKDKIQNQTNEREKLSGLVLEVNEAMQNMADGLTSPFTCITSHTLQYTMASDFTADMIDGKRRDHIIYPNKSRSFTDLLKLSLGNLSVPLSIDASRNRCNSLPNLLDVDYNKTDKITF